MKEAEDGRGPGKVGWTEVSLYSVWGWLGQLPTWVPEHVVGTKHRIPACRHGPADERQGRGKGPDRPTVLLEPGLPQTHQLWPGSHQQLPEGVLPATGCSPDFSAKPPPLISWVHGAVSGAPSIASGLTVGVQDYMLITHWVEVELRELTVGLGQTS